MRSDQKVVCYARVARNLNSGHAIIFVGVGREKTIVSSTNERKKSKLICKTIRAKPKTEKLPRSEKFPLLKFPAVCFYEARTEVLLIFSILKPLLTVSSMSPLSKLPR